MKTATRKVTFISFPVDVKQRHIDDGECRLAAKCMIKIAIEELLRARDQTVGHHYTVVRAQGITFNFHGYKYKGTIPTKALNALKRFDSEEKARKAAERRGEQFVSAVKPFTFKLEAERGRAVQKFSEERREQINAARKRRASEGRPDRTNYTLRKRLQGVA